jgi:hypothetical protein
MNRTIILILILTSLITGSCSGRKSKTDRRNLIREKDLVTVLTDVYITNGLLAVPKIQSWFPSIDSVSSYYYIIEKHGYSKETMDRTMKYYFIKQPKKLIEIYDQVLGNLSEMESLVEKEVTLSAIREANVWKGKEFYYLPESDDIPRFDITFRLPGTYKLTFTAIFFPDDQSVHPRFTAYTCHPDSVETGKRKYIESIEYLKDGQPHAYSYIIRTREYRSLHIRGWLYDSVNYADEWGKHVIIKDISFTSIPTDE